MWRTGGGGPADKDRYAKKPSDYVGSLTRTVGTVHSSSPRDSRLGRVFRVLLFGSSGLEEALSWLLLLVAAKGTIADPVGQRATTVACGARHSKIESS